MSPPSSPRPGLAPRPTSRPGAGALALAVCLSGMACTRDEAPPAPAPPTVETLDAGPSWLDRQRTEARGDIDDGDRAFAGALTAHTKERYTVDLAGIKERGVLRVITRNNSTSYFLYRGTEAGFNYELAKLFADGLGVRLDMVVPPTNRDVIPWLLEGRGDIIISSLTTDAPRIDRVKLTRPYLESPLVVVVRSDKAASFKGPESLSGKPILVRPSSSSMSRLRQLAVEKQNLNLQIRASLESLEPEDLLDFVASGEAEATVLVKRIADVELMHRNDLAIAFELPGPPVKSAFATRPEDRHLWQAAQKFLVENYRGTVFNILYKRYFTNRSRTKNIRTEALRADKRGAITPWDNVFKAEAKNAGMGWRMLAAQAFQESRLNPDAVSPFGAVGLMQIMPATAAELGVKDPTDPVQSITGGARYMKKLLKRFTAPEIALKDRVRFALAAYNVGPGHVDDARALAEELGKNPDRWFGNVEQAMLLLSKPRYYQKARHGYCRGEEPVRYVSEIQSRYDRYVALTDPNNAALKNP